MKGKNAGRPEVPKGQESRAGKYTAVVYFHGMGEQRRYEEVSRLVDALDAYAYWQVQKLNRPLGRLEAIRARLETPRSGTAGDLGYVRVYHHPTGAGRGDMHPYRFYEAYWAPVTAGGRSAKEVFKWMLRQALTPLRTISSPWRERQRLRRSALHGLWESLRRAGYGPNVSHAEFLRLFATYNAFARPDARRDFARGSFSEFLRFMEKKTPRKSDPDDDREEQEKLNRRKHLAYQWRRRYVLLELRQLLVIASLVLVLGLGLGALFLGAGWLADWLSELSGRSTANAPAVVPSLLEKAAAYAEANQATVVAAILTLFGISGFLRNYMGDVQLWCTYEETDVNHRKRKEILRRGTDLLSHVLKDPGCDRVVVVAHSLGTAVAVDTLLELGRYNRARNLAAPIKGPLELEKLDILVTMGCPIDKIHYFFESQAGSNHRYQRVVQEVRGDIGFAPFARNRKPFIHWINYWDRADIISGSIETASNPRWSALRVDNVQVSNYRFPDPGASHSGYFEHRRVIGDLFDIVFRGEHSFLPSRMKPRRTHDYEQLFLGPGGGSPLVPLIQAGALALPWLILTGLLVRYWLPQDSALSGWLFAAGGILALGLISGFVIGRLLGHREPVKPRRQP